MTGVDFVVLSAESVVIRWVCLANRYNITSLLNIMLLMNTDRSLT